MEAKVVSTQTDIKPPPPQQHTPDHKTYVTEMRKELSEASTATPTWSPNHNGHFLVS